MDGQTPIVFRPFDSAADFETAADMWSRENPDWPMTADELRRQRAHRSGSSPWIELVGQIGGRPVCTLSFGEPFWAQRAGRKFLGHNQLPEFARVAFAAILDRGWGLAAESNTDELSIWTRDDRPAVVATLQDRGGAVVERQAVSRLVLEDFDPAPFREVVRRVGESGIRILSVAQLEREGSDWLTELHAATGEMVRDIPSAQAPTKPSLETFAEWLEDELNYDRERMFVALDGRKIVGYTRSITSQSDPSLLFTGLSGVLASHRRRGIVTAIKVHALLEFRRRGARTIQTDNLEQNPMRAINEKLGFRPCFTWLHFVFAGPFRPGR